jgi:hypothetical protein
MAPSMAETVASAVAESIAKVFAAQQAIGAHGPHGAWIVLLQLGEAVVKQAATEEIGWLWDSQDKSETLAQSIAHGPPTRYELHRHETATANATTPVVTASTASSRERHRRSEHREKGPRLGPSHMPEGTSARSVEARAIGRKSVQTTKSKNMEWHKWEQQKKRAWVHSKGKGLGFIVREKGLDS